MRLVRKHQFPTEVNANTLDDLRPLPRRFYARDSVTVARALLGCVLVHDTADGRVAGRIVEVEAYEQTDPASHSFVGRTARNAVMFGPGGYAYVYLSYGVHWCLNVATDREGFGAAVLLRAARPLVGVEVMAARRRLPLDEASLVRLARGPGCLTQAFGVTIGDNGLDLTASSLRILRGGPRPDERVIATPRIGITKAADRPWRFVFEGDRFVSAARPVAARRRRRST